MKNRNFLILILIAIFITETVFSQNKNQYISGFATVDYSLCVAFHPYMASYDFAKKRFLKPGVNFRDKTKMELYQKEISSKRKSLAPKIKLLKKRRYALLNTINRSEEEYYNSKNQKLKDQKSVKAMEAAHEKKINSLNTNIANINIEISKLEDEITSKIYYSKHDTDVMMQKIFTEVDKTIARISKQAGGLAIIDSSYISAPAPQMTSPASIDGLDSSGASLYAQLLGFQFNDPTKGTVPRGHHLRVTAGLNAYFKSLFNKYVSQNAPLRSFVSNARGRLFLTGSRDITKTVVSQILVQHRIDAGIRASILRLISQVE